jgi:ubiquinol-cytochrome c reductase cytochrome b subunit
LFYLHKSNSSNTVGVLINDRVTFYPYFILKDLAGVAGVLVIYSIVVLYFPNVLGHSDNYIEANPLVTPSHIVPEWYFLPFYAILRGIPNKLGGVICMFSAILIFFFMPFIDKNLYFSPRFNPVYGIMFFFFSLNTIFLGWLGGKPVEYPYTCFSIFFTFCYFLYILITLPFFSLLLNYIQNKNDLPLP